MTLPSISIVNSSITESDTGTKNLVFTLTLSAASPLDVRVQVDTNDETAAAGFDYQAVHQLVSFAAGATTATVSVPIIGNSVFEPNRAFEVILSSPTNGSISGLGMAWGVIVDDDTPPSPAAIPSDPGYPFEWYLYTIRAEYAWQLATGAGVKVGVFDQGIDAGIADLAANLDLDLGRVAATLAPGGAPVLATDQHGTEVAGVIAAARDGKGLVGVAYDAQLVSIYSSFSNSDTDITEIVNAFAYAKSLDVLNNSWAYTDPQTDDTMAFFDNANDPQFAPAFLALKDLVATGRNGLGTIVVQSAGNGYSYGDDTNLHNFQNSRFVITVGSTDYFGQSPPYSNSGASVLVSAPGGVGSGTYGNILTTESSGSAGPDLPNAGFVNGTSFSTPVVSGVVALMLQANPNLGYRDVQQILAYTARQIDTGKGSWNFNGATDWNGGGLHYNADDHASGFGQVDALAAVRLAASWSAAPQTVANTTEVVASQSVNQPIPDNNPSGVTGSIAISDPMTVERVDVTANITHPLVGDLEILLTSPAGTQSWLLWQPAQGTLDQQDIHFTFDSVLDWGESARGNWTLKVIDAAQGDVGTFDSWTIALFGKAASPDRSFIFTNEYPDLVAADSSRGILADPSGGNDTINAAALGTDDRIDLSGATPSVIYDANFTIAPGTLITTALGGEGNDVLIANNSGCLLSGAGGNDTLTGGTGNDTLAGGSGSDVTLYGSPLATHTVTKTGSSYAVTDKSGTDGTDTLSGIERLEFADMTVNTGIQSDAATIPSANLQRLEEFYIAFFNRVPDADGLMYWIDQLKAGQSLNQIANNFYSAGLANSDLTGYSDAMSDAGFVSLIYKNALGRNPASFIPLPDADVNYWVDSLSGGGVSRGSLVNLMLTSAHTYQGDATWGWVVDLLEHKVAVATTVAINMGLSYSDPDQAITQGMAIAAAVTSTDTSHAISLIGIDPASLHLS